MSRRSERRRIHLLNFEVTPSINERMPSKTLKICLEDIGFRIIKECKLCGEKMVLSKLSEHNQREHRGGGSKVTSRSSRKSKVQTGNIKTVTFNVESKVLITPIETRNKEWSISRVGVDAAKLETRPKKHPMKTVDKANYQVPKHRRKHKHKKSPAEGSNVKRPYRLCCFCQMTFKKRSSHLVHLMHVHANHCGSEGLKIPFSNPADIFTCKISRAEVLRNRRGNTSIPEVAALVKTEPGVDRTDPQDMHFTTFPKSVPLTYIHYVMKKRKPCIQLVDCGTRIKVPCSQCGLDIQFSHLTQHIQAKHIRAHQRKCDMCDYVSPRGILHEHMTKHYSTKISHIYPPQSVLSSSNFEQCGPKNSRTHGRIYEKSNAPSLCDLKLKPIKLAPSVTNELENYIRNDTNSSDKRSMCGIQWSIVAEVQEHGKGYDNAG